MQRSSRTRRSRAFTLVEALISAVVLAFAAVTMVALYFSGMQALEAQGERAVLDGCLRSRMEQLISTKFGQLANGSETVTVDGANHTIQWTVANVDLNGDSIPESDAKQITVTLDNRSLTTILVDHAGKVGKL